ncbi:type IV secretory system conjugative DNA transfer family protein, partial [Thioclava sp.]|uniref:type IV secretory system conjugative DNA transfer family protein n=1 Tax=Thioclava sp. TaxID=1933450 RepID=UPI003242F9D9
AYGGHLAIVTQTIPALDKIYGEDTRLSLQGGAGVKIYLAPSEQRTKSELSAAVGKTTHRVTSKSKTIGKGPFAGVNISERSEDRDLLTEDEAGRLHEDTVIILANGQHPIKARRIKYFDDRMLKPIFLAQKGQLPAPDPKDAAIRDLRGDLVRTTHQLEVLTSKVQDVAKRSRVKAALPSLVFKAPEDPRKVKSTGGASNTVEDKNKPARATFVMRRKRELSNTEIQQTEINTDDEKVQALLTACAKVDAVKAEDDNGVSIEAAE